MHHFNMEVSQSCYDHQVRRLSQFLSFVGFSVAVGRIVSTDEKGKDVGIWLNDGVSVVVLFSDLIYSLPKKNNHTGTVRRGGGDRREGEGGRVGEGVGAQGGKGEGEGGTTGGRAGEGKGIESRSESYGDGESSKTIFSVSFFTTGLKWRFRN